MTRFQPKTERPLHLLLVEDDPNDQLLFCAAARRTRLNLRVHCVGHGQEAVAYLEGTGPYLDRILHPLPEVMVLDLRMPVMDGFEVLAWCQTSPVFRSLPVVVLSGSMDEKSAEHTLALGAGKFFLKPSRLQDWLTLVRNIREFVGRPSPPAELVVEADLALH